jgi:hypothetical protein
MKELMNEIEAFTATYEFNFQFWGEGNNNVYISKDDVDLYDSGGYNTIEEVLVCALTYLYKINRVAESDKVWNKK